MQTNIHANERPSRFLKQRIAVFSEVLTFFASEPSRQIAFLLQVDFWDWEMDGIVFAVENFAARSAAWSLSGRTADDMLATRGIFLTMKSRKRYAACVRTFKVLAPASALSDLINQWHRLLEACASLIDHHESVRTREAGGLAMEDLSRYRKTVHLPDAG